MYLSLKERGCEASCLQVAKNDLTCYYSDMNYLLITFDGFGDGIMYYPIFKEIGKKMSKSLFLYTSNIFFSDESMKEKIQIPSNFISTKDSFRKFPKSSWKKTNTFLKNNNVDVIINLRTISRRFEKDYYDFKEYLISKDSNIIFYDDELLTDKEKLDTNIRNIILKIIQKGTGKKLPYSTSTLKSLFQPVMDSNRILINMHSGGSFKSWESKKWTKLISSLVLSNKKVGVYEGFSENEKLYTKEVIENLPAPIRNKPLILRATNLYELAILLQNSFVLVSVDSGLIHLADSIGITSIGIYITTSPFMWGGITNKFHYVNSDHMLDCKNFYPFFGMCINNKQKCEEISQGKDDITVGSVLEKINEIYHEKKN